MSTQKPPPEGWPRISAAVFYDDAAAAIDWLCRAFGFEIRLRIEGDDGRIVHSELEFGEGLIMISQVGDRPDRPEAPGRSPSSLGGAITQSLCLFVDDADAHCDRARSAGARIVTEPMTSDYGDDYWSDRSYRALDPEGHAWWFMQRLRGTVARAT
ncbi:MAG: VOC family protein [Nannocystaceae bacterium]